MTSDQQVVLDSLREALSRLAEVPSRQSSYLSTIGVAPLLDELALEFSDLFILAKPSLALLRRGEEAITACTKLDSALSDETLGWHVEDLTSEGWFEIRRLARTSLDAVEVATSSLGV